MRPISPLSLDRFALGSWRVEVARDEVLGQGSLQGQVHKLEPRAMRLLAVLAQAGGEVVTSDALLDAVWPGLVVTNSSLYDAVAQLRKVLGAEHIATVPRRGYRLVTPAVPIVPTEHYGTASTVGPTRADPPTATLPGPRAPDAEPRLGPRSVAVMPFVMRGLPESLSFLSESLTGGLIAELSRQPGLAVVAHGTMLTFGQKHPPPADVVAELGVRFVVDGQLEQRDTTLHVGVQVVDGRRGTQSWADELTLPLNAWHATASVVVGC